MRTIQAVPISTKNFRPYGSFYNMLSPAGNCFPGEESDFFPDPVTLSVSGREQIAFSSLTVRKPEKMIIKKSEYHNWTGEGILFLDDDAVMHVAPPSNKVITPEKTEAFIVPKGTIVKLNTGVWHLSPYPLHNDVLHLMIIMPERVYGNDCYVCNFPEESWMEIIL
ncbi:MAG: ureidoglycolate lyase [Lachnospiraceae bacterium]|nr:ureidoglycolate lyase [Lachnospiraceae bacterium]